jgi:phytoene dehydrogenase-like protein/NAD-dependent dihydropyrimidine dehydrogenase PreA subunit
MRVPFSLRNTQYAPRSSHSSLVGANSMQLKQELCTGCGYCILVCPYDALKSNGWAEVIPANCTNCNLCIYACPTDCFVPEAEFPLKPHKPRIKEAYDVVIIGSGLGGLMAGVALAQAGQSVAVFEKLSFPGGRYTELDYKGAAVTTGAWTNLGPKSHIGRFLAELGIELDYISLKDVGLVEQYSLRFPDGRHYANLFDLLTPAARKAWLKAILKGREQISGETASQWISSLPAFQSSSPPTLYHISTADYIAQFSADPDLLAAVEAIAATASGLNSKLIPASEYIQITFDGREAGRDFAMPRGGVRAIIKALTKALCQVGGELFVRSPVTEILLGARKMEMKLQPSNPSTSLRTSPPTFQPSKFPQVPMNSSSDNSLIATGIKLADGREVRSRVVIHNGGPSRFVQLVGASNLPLDYLARLTTLKGVECAALFGATREPLFTDAPITMTPKCRRVVGIFSPTLLDPKLSKNGLHLFDAFFPTYGDNRTAELELALADLRDLFPNFDEVVEWTVPMFFTGAWPGTESGQTFGQTGDNRLDPATPIQNCFLVGMDVKGSGVAGDLIPLGVRRVLAYLAET